LNSKIKWKKKQAWHRAEREKQSWQDLHDDNKSCMQSSYWELILENGQ
jgi:hypothetical protein